MVEQYLPNRLAKYAILFYKLYNSEYTYCFPIFDNGKINRINNSQSDRYTLKRWYFTNNLYTRHTFAKQLLYFTDGEAHIIEMCELSLMDKLNQKNVREALRIIVKNDVKRNEQILVRVYDDPVLKNIHGAGSVELDNAEKRKKMLAPVQYQ